MHRIFAGECSLSECLCNGSNFVGKIRFSVCVFLVDAYCMWDRKAILIGEEMGRVLSLLILRRLSGHGFYLLFVTRVFVKNSRCVVSCVGV